MAVIEEVTAAYDKQRVEKEDFLDTRQIAGELRR